MVESKGVAISLEKSRVPDAHKKMDQVLETLEVLMDEATLKRLKRGEEELKAGNYVDAAPGEIEEILR